MARKSKYTVKMSDLNQLRREFNNAIKNGEYAHADEVYQAYMNASAVFKSEHPLSFADLVDKINNSDMFKF